MEFKKKTVKDVPIAGKIILLRADYNVPLDESGKIRDDFRIKQSIPTIEYLLEQDCKIVICSHLGRPNGKSNPKFSLEPIATRLSELLGQRVEFINQSLGDKVSQTVKKSDTPVFLLENLRFHPGEEADDPHFAARLAIDSHAQYFVQDGFGVAHRKHASTDAITHNLPSVAGLLLEKEFNSITSAIEAPKRPLVIILGGAKVSDKIPVIERFIELADTVVVGGAIANTFLKFYNGYEIGKSVHDDNASDVVAMLMNKVTHKWCQSEDHGRLGNCKESREHFILPSDVAVGKSISLDAARQDTTLDQVSTDDFILDIGPNSIGKILSALESVKTVIWNGPVGYFESPQFAYGSNFVAGALASNKDIKSVVGGGDTADFVLNWAREQGVNAQTAFSHISTGGGASLELMAGANLPAIASLMDK